MRVFHGIAEFEQAIGAHLAYSDWQTVTQDQIDTFAESIVGRQWIHIDPEEAAAGPSGTTIAHGFLTLSLVPMLVWQIYTVEGVRMGVNYGANKLRFPSRVLVGSMIRAGVELISVSPGGGGYQVVAQVTVERAGADKPACVVDTVSVLVP